MSIHHHRRPNLPSTGEEKVTEDFDQLLVGAIRLAKPVVKRILFAYPTVTFEDVLQNASLKAWLKFPTFGRRCKFSTWFMRIAINEALMYRRRQRQEFVDLESVVGMSIDRLSPEAQVLAREGNARLVCAVKNLSAKGRSEVLRWSQAGKGDPLNSLSRNKAARFHAWSKLRVELGGTVKPKKVCKPKVRSRHDVLWDRMSVIERRAWIQARLRGR